VKTLDAEQVIQRLGLAPHPEGGFFRETFRAPAAVAAPFGPVTRAASTAIYFLLRAGDFSAFHSVQSDEVWHHYLGATLELYRALASSAMASACSVARSHRASISLTSACRRGASYWPDSPSSHT
jgi:predicted cupin superfamily sugar epimerase